MKLQQMGNPSWCFVDSAEGSLYGLDTNYIRKSNVAEKSNQQSSNSQDCKRTVSWKWLLQTEIYFLVYFLKHFQWWTSMQLSLDLFRHPQPWSCFLLQLFWFSLWKPMPSGTSSPGRLFEVSRLTFDTYCCELNCDWLFWHWLYMIASRISWYVASIQGHEAGQLEELRQILSCQRKLRRCQKRTRGQMGCKGDQVSVQIFASSQIITSCSPYAVFLLQRCQGVGTNKFRPRCQRLCCWSGCEPLGSEWRRSQYLQTTGTS